MNQSLCITYVSNPTARTNSRLIVEEDNADYESSVGYLFMPSWLSHLLPEATERILREQCHNPGWISFLFHFSVSPTVFL